VCNIRENRDFPTGRKEQRKRESKGRIKEEKIKKK
jgi:hypothetical protein